MRRTALTTILLLGSLATAQPTLAGVFMCVDPDTGKKTFTDRACPTKEKGSQVKVQTTNFGDGVANKRRKNATWTSHIDTTVSGRENFDEDPEVATSVNGNGLLGADS